MSADGYSRANEGSILAVQVFDQKKFKKKDQGFLGVINIRVGDVMQDLGPDTDGACLTPSTERVVLVLTLAPRSNAHPRSQEIDGQPRGPWKGHRQPVM